MQREQSRIRPLKSRLTTSINNTMASAGESSKSSRDGSRALALPFSVPGVLIPGMTPTGGSGGLCFGLHHLSRLPTRRLLRKYSGSRDPRLTARVPRRLCAFRQRRGLDVRRSTVVSAAPEPKAKNERRRGVAALRRGGETQDQPHNRHVPTNTRGMTLHVEGLGWHGPDHAARGAPVVGAPNRSYGYGVVAPTHAIARVPRIWGRGIPNAAHCTSSAAF